jgi:asparagine synthase (glutamine-hydrolysing)
VAERYGTEHHVLPVRSDIRHDLPGLVAAMGEPCGDASAATLFAISKMARRQVTVALTGDGGDEAFGGYNHFLAYYYTGGRLFRHLPAPVGALVARGGKALRRLPGPVGRAGTFLRIAAAPVERTFGLVFSYLEAPLRAALFTPDFAAELAGHEPQGHYPASLADGNGALPVDRVMQAHLKTDLADGFLVKVDVATMGASLEARSPFLDLDVMELAMRVPAALRFTGGRTKGLLRQLAYRHMPAACIDRPKHGFNTPTGLWVRNWPDLVQDLVLGPQVERRGWFRRAALEGIVRENSARMKRGSLLWTLMVLELWLRMTVDGTLDPDDSV